MYPKVVTHSPEDDKHLGEGEAPIEGDSIGIRCAKSPGMGREKSPGIRRKKHHTHPKPRAIRIVRHADVDLHVVRRAPPLELRLALHDVLDARAVVRLDRGFDPDQRFDWAAAEVSVSSSKSPSQPCPSKPPRPSKSQTATHPAYSTDSS